MKDMGGEENLVMFLSGMGGTGKSEVIKAFVDFARGVSLLFGWNYNTDVVKITALTGAAACQIPNGKTLHSTACLSSTKIGKESIESWKSTKVIIIDEVSFLDEDNLKKFDRNMKKPKQNTVCINPRGSVPRQNTLPQEVYFAKGLSQGFMHMYMPMG